ncbi:MAG TPA: thiolase domain-containing protein, partial [Candidatus Eremiobacteraeota bacterium]|nr:thiolase domain-containing protein [Candidatus Eremiobacteraeota bacterium]
MNVSILGTYNSKFGKLEDKTIYDLIIEAGKEAIEDSGLKPKEIDAIYVGNYSSGGFNNQEHLAPAVIDIHPDLRFKPVVKVEAACASSSAAIYQGVYAVLSGRFKNVLVIGAEKMTELKTKDMMRVLGMASYWPEEGGKGDTFPGLFGKIAIAYQEHYGYSDNQMRKWLALSAAKAYKNAQSNPLAHMPSKLTCNDILNLPDDKNVKIAGPLRLHDCSLVSDGSSAIVITTTDRAKSLKDKVVEFAGIGHMTDYLQLGKREAYRLTGAKKAIEEALKEAKITIKDVNVAEIHDCFTITEILLLEAMGLTEEGKGWTLLEDENSIIYPGGKLPVNLSGGLKAKGHPVGATGASMHVLIAKQLMGEAIGLQAEGAETGLTFNIGGSG